MEELKVWKEVLDYLELHLININSGLSTLNLNDYKDIEMVAGLKEDLNSARSDLERVSDAIQEVLNRWK